ncbi:MAG: Gfo/Idh/MocA family oxidoreductase [Armatimonadota bacterium]|nr:Gfo/Idh/MocA family oxidoreductase [Armatimonadota bacterium]
MIGIGLVGAGGIGRHLGWQLRPLSEARLMGVYDADLTLAQRAATELETHAYPSLDALLDNPAIEAVILATPPHTHYELGLQILQRGKHLFCEKPMALTVEHCDALIQAAQQANRILMVGHVLRLFPLFWQSKQWLQEGVVGEPVAVQVQRRGYDIRLFKEGWRANPAQSGGFLLEMNVHELDYLRWLIGDYEVVAAQGTQPLPEPSYVQHWQALLRFHNGAIGVIEASIVDTLGGYFVRIVGTEGTLEHTGFSGAIRYKRINGEERSLTPEEIGTPEPFMWELRSFVRAIAYGETPLYDGYDGRMAVANALAVQRLIEQSLVAQPRSRKRRSKASTRLNRSGNL